MIPDLTDKDIARFYANVQKTKSCWKWLGRKLKKTGRGLFRKNKQTFYAPRISYLINKGDIGNMCVLHSCDNPNCVNPKHLNLGTQTENIKDRDNKGRNRLSHTHCKRGHQLSETNTRYYGPNKRKPSGYL